MADGKITRLDHVPCEMYQELLEETNSLKKQALHREEEMQTLKGMLAQKDKEIVRLEDQLHLRDATLSKLRALIEIACTEFDIAKERNRNPEASATEKHEKESLQEINGTTSTVNEIGVTNQDGNTPTSADVPSILGETPPLFSTVNGPPLPPTEAKIPREIPSKKEAKQDYQPLASAPIIYSRPIPSVFKQKGRQPPPPPPPPPFKGATPTPARKFNFAPRPAPPPPSRPPPLPPPMEPKTVGATPTTVRKFNITPPSTPPPPPPPPPPMKVNTVGATPNPVRNYKIAPRQRPPPPPPPPPPPMEAYILRAIPTPVRKYDISPPPRIEANITGATQTPLRRYPPNNTITKPSSSTI